MLHEDTHSVQTAQQPDDSNRPGNISFVYLVYAMLIKRIISSQEKKNLREAMKTKNALPKVLIVRAIKWNNFRPVE